jgi:sec-independent protein translocase protein TatA
LELLFGSLGWSEIVGILIIILLLFGAKKLPELGNSLGRGMREFKDGISGLTKDEPVSPPAPPAPPASKPEEEKKEE